MLPTNVVTPEILTLSNSVCPSTSKSPLASIFPATVIPLVTSKVPVTLAPLDNVSSFLEPA